MCGGLTAFMFATKSQGEIPKQMAPNPCWASYVEKCMKKKRTSSVALRKDGLETHTHTHRKEKQTKCQDVVHSTPCDHKALFQVAASFPPFPWLMRAEQMPWIWRRGSKERNGAFICASHDDSFRFFTFASAASGCVCGCVNTCVHCLHKYFLACVSWGLLSICIFVGLYMVER